MQFHGYLQLAGTAIGLFQNYIGLGKTLLNLAPLIRVLAEDIPAGRSLAALSSVAF